MTVWLVFQSLLLWSVCRALVRASHSNVPPLQRLSPVAANADVAALRGTPRAGPGRVLPASRKSFLNRITFNWVTELMEVGNSRVLQIKDLWAFDEDSRVGSLSEKFSQYFDQEKAVIANQTFERNASVDKSKKMSVIQEFWASPVTRAVVKMYRRPLTTSGLLKMFNTIVQFLPSIIIARLLGGIDKAKLQGEIVGAAGGSLSSSGMALALSLFIALSSKTFLENQYFYTVIDLGANIRGALSAAIYRKALKLSPAGRQNNTVGEIVNYIQIDTNRMEQVAGTIHVVWDGIFQIVGYTSLLFHFIGPSVFAGIAAMLVIVPLNAIFLKQLSALRVENLKLTDARVKLTNELIQGVRTIKSYNWERAFVKQLNDIRTKEIAALKAAANTRAILVSILSAAPSFVAVLSLGMYALLGNVLTPTKVFTALALFNQLRFPLIFLPMLLNTLAEGKISLARLTRFLMASELQSYVNTTDPRVSASSGVSIAVRNATFSWDEGKMTASSNESTSIPSSRGRLANIDFQIKQGELVAIVGPVGSGKSTLMSALLGELFKVDGQVSIAGRVAYVSQSAWIPNDSLQNVVLFGKDMNTSRYAEALEVSELTRDLELLESGDQTEIGEKGVNLSGGQKQRVSIARAVYDDADIYLFDDPLSALDNQVATKVFRGCIKGALKTKTRVIATNQLSILPEFNRIILLAKSDDDSSCRILDQGSFQELLSRGHDLSKIVPKREVSENETPKKAASISASPDVVKTVPVAPLAGKPTAPLSKAKEPTKLMTTEERGEGAVSGDVWRSYMRAAKNPALVLMILASFVFANACQQFQQWVIVAWTGDASYKKMAMTTYLLGVTAMATGVAFFNWLRTYLACILGAEASRTMHHDLAQKVLAAPLSFFESTPVGRLLQRFTKDLDLIDQQLPGSFGQFIASTLNILASLVAIVFVTPSFAAVLGPLVFVYILVTNYYRGVARELKRLDSLSRSPVFAHFSETLGGLSTIRSYRRQGMFSALNEVKLEDNLAAYYALKVVDRWLSVRLELLGNLVVFAAALLAVWSGSRSGPSGLSLNNALSTTSLLNWAVRNGAETESLMNSVERVLYTTRSTPQEAATYVDHYATPLLLSAKDATQLPSNDTELLVGGWPWNGGIKFSNCIMRYRDDFQPVLLGISLSINPGENVGIVGRTGSGKSSLFRALLRLTELEGGHITIDGVDIRSVGLDALRSSIAIIPQDPVLFSGSVRYVLYYTQFFCVPSPFSPFSLLTSSTD